MCRRLIVGLIISFVAALTVPIFTAIGELKRDGPITAEARVDGSVKLVAMGDVEAPKIIRGAWDISVKSGNQSGGDSGHYPKGVHKRYTVEAHTATASAKAWITGYNKHGDTYSIAADDESGG